ncbi:MAG TPA: 2-C-methyl-D-erythritol 4-phosphate cytidylyltransferase [Thermodesulfobacteriota bacterium]|nr:2-C-methyl-D-erythritol 4-phosphate cytidylyltransferase [Thermodesulfobacteriota bacterium]
MASNDYISAIIVAGGTGRRFGNGQKKQFIQLAGKPILFYSIDAFQRCELVSEIVLVLPADNIEFYKNNLSGIGKFDKVRTITEGGQTRQQSVLNGLQKLSEITDIVLVHDAARPLVNISTINRVIEQTIVSDCAICAVSVSDTVKQASENLIEKTVPRDNLWLAQTPQGIKYELIKRAYKNALDNNLSCTDEASLVEELGVKPAIVPGPKNNIKITTPDDLKLAEFYLMEHADV